MGLVVSPAELGAGASTVLAVVGVVYAWLRKTSKSLPSTLEKAAATAKVWSGEDESDESAPAVAPAELTTDGDVRQAIAYVVQVMESQGAAIGRQDRRIEALEKRDEAKSARIEALENELRHTKDELADALRQLDARDARIAELEARAQRVDELELEVLRLEAALRAASATN